jgi:RimJ/RimL family protein N-acetyltransferase
MSNPAEEAALARVPDLPQWVDTRGMLLTGHAVVRFPSSSRFETDGFVVELAARALLAAIDNPPVELIAQRARAMQGDVNVLCTEGTADAVASALPSWVRRRALLHALPGLMVWEREPDLEDVSILTAASAPSLAHVPEPLREELIDALEGFPMARFVPGTLPERSPRDASPAPVPLAAAWIDRQPVAFCYPALQTETLWDVAVDTVDGYRGRGLAGRAARAMIRHMRKAGKAPVWGALETNTASLSVARKLGFVATGRLVVFAKR